MDTVQMQLGDGKYEKSCTIEMLLVFAATAKHSGLFLLNKNQPACTTQSLLVIYLRITQSGDN